MLPHEVLDDASTVGCGVVILQDCSRTHGLESGHDERLHDLISVPDGIQIALNKMKRSSVVKMNASPHHNRAPTMTVVLSYTGLNKSLARVPPDSSSGIIVGESEAGLICEENSAPMMPGPQSVTTAPSQSCLVMGWSGFALTGYNR